MDKYTELPYNSSNPEGFLSLTVGGKPWKPSPTTAPAVRPVVKEKRPSDGRSGSGLQPRTDVLDTLEIEHGSSPLGKLSENRLHCVQTANFLISRPENDTTSPLHKAARNIRSCSILGAFRSLSDTVNYKIGQALCRNRLCPNCQRVLSAKRKADFLAWYDLNSEELKKYGFYHMTLTVRHSRALGLRDGLYTSDLTSMFAALRGTGSTNNRAQKKWWNQRVAGGACSVELAPGKDGSPHIHLHILLMANKGFPLYAKDRTSQFFKRVLLNWKKITGELPTAKIDQSNKIEPVYYYNDEGVKTYAEIGNVDSIRAGVAECMKYTLKSDAESLQGYSDAFLADLLTTKNRYYMRFGLLSKKTPGSEVFQRLDMLCSDYKDLEQIKKTELAQLLNPETGEIVSYDTTRIAVTFFRNTKTKPIDSEIKMERGSGAAVLHPISHYYQFGKGRVVYHEPDHKEEARKLLARSVGGRYNKENDLIP